MGIIALAPARVLLPAARLRSTISHLMRTVLRALRRAAVRVWRARYLVPLTPLGAVVAALGYWLVARVGREKYDLVLFAAGLLALLVVALALAGVLLLGLLVWLRLRQAPAADLELETGLTAGTGLRLPCLARWPLLQLRVLWEEPGEVEVSLLRRGGGGCEELIRPLERGEVSRVVRRLVVSDLFGFARLGPARASAAHLRVIPVRARITAHVTRRFLGGDALSWPSGPAEGELIEMRRYAYGDPLRHVLWKAFARTRKLLVRTPERAITPLPSAAAYFVAGPADEPCASAARHFVEEGLLGSDFLFAADGALEPTADPGEALLQVVRSASHRDAAGEGLHRFLARLEENRRKSCVLFVPPQAGPWLERVERCLTLAPGARAVTAIDAEPRGPATARWRRWLFAEGGDATRARRSLAEVVRRLSARGLEVSVLHRPTGELLGPAQLSALELAA